MAKLSQAQKFARLLNNLAEFETRVTANISGAIANYHREGNNPAALSYIYTGISMSPALRSEQLKSINEFINTFAGVSVKTDVDGNQIKDNSGNIVLQKSDAKLEKVYKAFDITVEMAKDEVVAIIERKIAEWLTVRGGTIFGKVKKETVKKTDEQKIALVKENRVKKLVSDMNNLGMSQAEKVEVALSLITSLGFADVAAFQAAIDSTIQ